MNFQEYQKAKENITAHQKNSDFLIYNSDDKSVSQIAQKTKAQKLPFNRNLILELKKIIKPSENPLVGEFNLMNILAGVLVVRVLGVADSQIKKGVKLFKPLPHRLEFVGKFKGIEFYDNSMATIPETTILDLATFNGKPISLIVGGSEKGSDYTNLAKKILETQVKNLIILGQGTGQKILERVKLIPQQRNEFNSFQVKSMEAAVRVCYEKTPKNGVCLLSPAAASFNLFKDYKERGELFKKNVKKFATTK
ncbi:MAG: hypothetical protein NTV62_01305 [Candidatus Gribaldobacteria bacterium]|nr:hypothetical protein [Candidatus Gribaldobacteria bacterium]